jgi:hypothetical protein
MTVAPLQTRPSNCERRQYDYEGTRATAAYDNRSNTQSAQINQQPNRIQFPFKNQKAKNIDDLSVGL